MLSLGVYKEIQKAEHLYVRTKAHPVLQELQQEGITLEAYDHLYEQFDTFEPVYEAIVGDLLKRAKVQQEIYYAVPGHPLVAEQTVQLLLQEAEQGSIQINIVGGHSFIDPLLTAVTCDPIEGFLLLDALTLKVAVLNPACHTVVTQVYDAQVASLVKLTLMEVYPDDYPITIVTAAGVKGLEAMHHIPLFELDRITGLSNLTAVFIKQTAAEAVINRTYQRSRDIIRALRGPDGCPWDKEQTHKSLRKYVLEEANELVEAIDEEDVDHLIEELGDVLLQVFLHAQIGEDEGFFNMEDVLQSLNEKMIRRHPHVFGNAQITTTKELHEQWHRIKNEEKSFNFKKNEPNQ
jgi:tetrapyrrole methylase family protein/MazG family protein